MMLNCRISACLIALIVITGTPVYAELNAVPKLRNNAIGNETNINRRVNLNKDKSVPSKALFLFSYRFKPTAANQSITTTSGDLALDNNVDANAGVVAELIGKALAYPSPFRLQTGGDIGYKLSKAMTIKINVYDMVSNLIWSEEFKSGTPGGLAGYNRVVVNFDTFDGFALAAGVYFYVILNDGNVLGKGKMAVVP